MGAKDYSLVTQFPNFCPRQAFFAFKLLTLWPDKCGGQKNRGRKAILMEYREGMGVKVAVAVVESQNYVGFVGFIESIGLIGFVGLVESVESIWSIWSIWSVWSGLNG